MNSNINAAKPKRLSDSFSALPALVALMQALDGSAGAVLDESLVSEPDYEIPRRLNRILDHVLTLAEGAIDVEDPDRETVLGATKELMFEISSATEYLRSILSERRRKFRAPHKQPSTNLLHSSSRCLTTRSSTIVSISNGSP